jgi:hypothetical protein
VRVKRQKIFSRKSFFFKNDFAENMLRRKSFYVETNGAQECRTIVGASLYIYIYIWIGLG